MAPSLYLINPVSDFPTYYSAEVMAARSLRPAAFAADLAISTLAGMAPPELEVKLCEENVSSADLNTPADIIGITGKVNQWNRMAALADAYRSRGKTVMIGGSFASLCPDVVRPHCDVLVRGEIEELAPQLFGDLLAGQLQDEYQGGKPELDRCVMPRWDLYPNDHAMLGMVQTSRGCPFECEFCDVIQYVGRKQRHKPVAMVLAELDQLYRIGYRIIFIADDNFTVYRQRAKELLEALAHWNRNLNDGRVRFITQLSIDAATDDELLRMCAEAGLTNVFIGIETPNEESLRETRKRQNMKLDLVAQVDCFVEHGIAVMGGMICGFDHDGPDIFERQYEFAMATPIMQFSLGALVAPAATPLHARLADAGRLIESEGAEVAAVPWATNITPACMTREELLVGIQNLGRRIYDPAAFGERVVRFIENVWISDDPKSPAGPGRLSDLSGRPVDLDTLSLLRTLRRMGPEEHALWRRVRKALREKPGAEMIVMSALTQYLQIRHMYDKGQFWETHIRAA